jgi:uncharacterized membrane protein
MVSKAFLSFLILSIAALIFHKSLDYFHPDFTCGYLIGKQNFFDGIFKYGLYAHIIGTPICILIGTLQIFFRFEKKYPKLHRNAGKVYVATVLFFAAPGGFIMAFSAIGGQLSELCFLLLAMLWMYFTYQAYKTARERNFLEHKKHMTRSFLLMLSAINLRILSFLFNHYLEFDSVQMYIWAAWLSWLPSLLIYELLLWKKSKA